MRLFRRGAPGSVKVMARFGIRTGIVLAMALLLAACGSNPSAGTSPSPSPSPTPSPSPSPAPTATSTPTTTPTVTPTPATGGLTRCLVSQLSLSTGQPNAGAGSVEQTFIFTNNGGAPCALVGYPGMQLLGNGGTHLPTQVLRTPGAEPTVTLAPSGTASFLAQWHSQTGYTTPCQTSEQVEVTPPNAYSYLVITQSITACPSGQINVTAVSAGSTGGQ